MKIGGWAGITDGNVPRFDLDAPVAIDFPDSEFDSVDTILIVLVWGRGLAH